jgi:hypothetical protein
MTLQDIASLATIFGVFVAAPLGGFKIWRRLDERLTEQDKQLVKINYQLWENGGNSMKDQMNRACADIHELKINQAVIKQKVGV